MAKETISVPFGITKQVKELGAVYNAINNTHEIDESNPNYAKVKQLVETFGQTKEKTSTYFDVLNNDIRFPEEDLTVNEEMSSSINPVILGKFDWGSILRTVEKWDVLKFLDFIRTYGLPEDKQYRINMLTFLNTEIPNQIYIPYDSLVEYNEPFRITYGWDVVKNILKIGNINGGNFNVSIHDAVNNGLIDEEQACLLRYVFPIAVSKEHIHVREEIQVPVRQQTDEEMEM